MYWYLSVHHDILFIIHIFLFLLYLLIVCICSHKLLFFGHNVRSSVQYALFSAKIRPKVGGAYMYIQEQNFIPLFQAMILDTTGVRLLILHVMDVVQVLLIKVTSYSIKNACLVSDFTVELSAGRLIYYEDFIENVFFMYPFMQ